MKKVFSLKRVLILVFIVAWILNFSEAGSSMEQQKPPEGCNSSTTNPDAFCKNKPSIDCGYCTVTSYAVQCTKSCARNKDCYDVGY